MICPFDSARARHGKLLAWLLVAGLFANTAFGDGLTTTVNGVSASITNYEPPGSFNHLEVINGGYLTNEATTGNRATMIGSSASTSSNNTMLVTGANSVYEQLANGFGFFYVGWGGTSNQMTISNGGLVINRAPSVTSIGEAGSNNVVLVTGGGSIWTNSNDLGIGSFGAYNRLQIGDGGTVYNVRGSLGGQPADGGAGNDRDNNIAVVTGTNSLWHNNAELIVGHVAGENNQVIVTNGGRVVSSHGILGNTASSSNNSVIVTGPGTTWSNTYTTGLSGTEGLWVGRSSTSNRLIIADGARVDAKHAFVGNNAGANGNSVLITGSNSLLQLHGTFFYMGWVGSGNQLTITNGGNLLSAATFNRIGSGGDGNSVLVTGNGSIWSNSGHLAVGRVASNNRLVIQDGGKVYNTQAWISGAGDGDNAGSGVSNNTALVTGTGSLWQNSADFTVGFTGSGAQLVISNGGRVVSTYGKIGDQAGADGGSVIVTGPGSTWTNTVNPGGNLGLWVGASGKSNQLTISNGGRVHTGGDLLVGQALSSAGNAVLITGSNSQLSVSGSMFFGSNSDGNQGTLSDGGRLSVSGNSSIGNAAGGSNTLFVVTDTGSVFSTVNTLKVGDESSRNRLRIENGGRVESGVGVIGSASFVRSNSVVVSGPGSLWNATSDIIVGFDGVGNSLVITNGGRVNSLNADIGSYHPQASSGSNNIAIVTGAGSVWSNSATGGGGVAGLHVGTRGRDNQLIISDGGRVDAFAALVGRFSTGNGNSLLVTGTNSLLNLYGGSSGYLIVSWQAGHGNQLVVSNGGAVNAGHVRVALDIADSSGSIHVTGNNSILRGLDLATGAGTGRVLVTDSGTLEINDLTASATGSISNRSAIYQFTSATPAITPGGGSIMMTNGTISYRGVTGADINNAQVGNISKSGESGFRLNNSSNAVVASYTFNSGNPSNYQRLALMNNSRWTSANLTIGTGGGLTGGAGDVVEVTQNFTINRNVNTGGEFDLASSTVLFSGNTGHTNAITGDDFGHNGSVGNDGFLAGNFMYGKLSLGTSSDTICFQCGETPLAASNALYVTWLDLLGSTNNVANLHSPTTINIYYYQFEPNNAYLNNAVYQLTDCNGGLGGLLMPAVPEPSALALLVLAGCAMAWRRRR